MQGVIAINRFGLGGRPGEAPPGDPLAWCMAQFDRFDPRPGTIAAHPRTAEAARRTALLAHPSGLDGRGLSAEQRRANQTELRDWSRAIYAEGVNRRLEAALVSETPFVERLVHFWANHFAVSGAGGHGFAALVGALGGCMEFDAIRPHVLGRFEEMLFAVLRHPAMLAYLDQTGSMGPNSEAAIVRNRYRRSRGQPDEFGPNENFAREVLELHTMGVDGGYGQADVEQLALALTGWSISHFVLRTHPTPAEPGQFVFHAAWHEPGARRILGQTYPQRGAQKAVAALRDIAAHPSTARYLSWKLARHFVADEPPEALVARMADRFAATGGDLSSVYAEMLRAPEAWTTAFAKTRPPWDWLVAALRAAGARSVEGMDAPALLLRMGQPVWDPGSPAGWPDVSGAWAGSNMLLRRIEVAGPVAGLAPEGVDVAALAASSYGGLLSEPTRREIARADGAQQAMAIYLLSREFHRR
jgi:uncharacterized protein (DUF1800 family)